MDKPRNIVEDNRIFILTSDELLIVAGGQNKAVVYDIEKLGFKLCKEMGIKGKEIPECIKVVDMGVTTYAYMCVYGAIGVGLVIGSLLGICTYTAWHQFKR